MDRPVAGRSRGAAARAAPLFSCISCISWTRNRPTAP